MMEFFEKARKFLPEGRKYWADYLFHFTEMKNAYSILKTGKLMSRNKVLEEGKMYNDNASHEVIEQTFGPVLNYARFYFRPLTPTQFHNEGLIKGNPTDKHCPNPVFFLFDLNLLTQYPGTSIVSEKTLSSSLSLRNATKDIKALNGYNYQKIYHLGSFDPAIAGDITQYRQAEFVVKDEVNLQNLKWVVTRSKAEKDTLLLWLHESGIFDYDDMIICDYEQNFEYMFYKKRLYVENVVLEKNFITVEIANKTIEYKFEYLIKYDDREVEIVNLDLNSTYHIPNNKYVKNYRFFIKVDGKPMYLGKYEKKDDFIF